MSSRFEAEFDGQLAKLLMEKLAETLKEDGFQETLRLPAPHITEYQREAEQIVLQAESAPKGHLTISVESEDLNVNPIVARAATSVIADVSAELFRCLPVDTDLARDTVSGSLNDMLSNQEM